MRLLPVIIFLALLTGAITTGVNSYNSTEHCIENDIRQALAQTMRILPSDRVDADTIRCYRKYITIDKIRDTARITVQMTGRGHTTEFVAESGCSAIDVFVLSDQRASGTLLAASILWMAGCMWRINRKHREAGYGGLQLNAEKSCFVAADGTALKLTPMQYELMEMFFLTPTHTLSKQEICDRLWPKKPDASDTLYTLIRRLKPVVEANSNLRIESERGKAYRLIGRKK